jgi:NADH:ubiquinone oxidoreductase subunit 5 (subunit L)/multisubunit Na+/H+ antiporter MnhA subunit
MLIASLSLVAVPFMTGFYSKDFILESSYGQFYLSGTTFLILISSLSFDDIRKLHGEYKH